MSVRTLNPDYSSFNSFLLSIGVLCIGLGVASPWLVLSSVGQEPISQVEFETLQPDAADVALSRLDLEQSLLNVVWPASIGFVSFGLFLAATGMVRAWQRQAQADRLEDLAVEDAEVALRMRALTPEEAAMRRRQEAFDVVGAPEADSAGRASDIKADALSEAEDKIRSAEAEIVHRLSDSDVQVVAEGGAFETARGPVQFDVWARPGGARDVVLEIKYLRVPSATILSTAARTLATLVAHLRLTSPRPVSALVVLVLPEDHLAGLGVDGQRELEANVFEGWAPEQRALVSLAVIGVDEIKSLDDPTFRGRLGF